MLEAGFDLFGVGDVDFYGEGFAARGSDFADEQGQLFFVARGYGHFRASFSKRERSVSAYALGGSGDQGDFVF